MKKGIVISDIHCGSIYGLLPPGFVTFEGVEKKLNVGQAYLWKCWENCCDDVRRFKPDFVIANADLVDGPQRKSEGAELALPSPKDQARAAVETLRLLRKATGSACKWYFTKGTPYHTGNWGDAEEDIAHKLAGEKYHSVGVGNYCRETLTLNVDGVLIEAAHHIAFASVYRSTPLEKESQAALMAVARRGIQMPDLMIRSHCHNYTNVEQQRSRVVTSPCWQLQTRYGRKSSVHRLYPDIGYLKIEIDPAKKKHGKTGCQVEAELYELPEIGVNKL